MKIVRSVFLILSSIILIVIISQYLFCPVYSFSGPDAFSGDSLYNPYSDITANKWVKCNFHAHAHCWKGITYGNATPADIHHVYAGLGYGVAAVSNYQMIDTTGRTRNNYLGAYEHGCNMLKNHQLVLGAAHVCWKDYYLPETISNKQDILNRLSAADSGSLFIINHPLVRGGYKAADFAKLTHYSCMEVLNPACNSSVLWDAALTAGRAVFIVGDDDSHNALDSTKTGKICTWISVPKINREIVLLALRSGKSYGMTIGESVRRQVRQGKNDSLPVLQDFSVTGNCIKAKFSLPAREMQVIGKGGSILATAHDCNFIEYHFSRGDAYARITADYGGGTKLFLNPVFRYQSHPLQQATATIDRNRTLLFRITGAVVLLFWFFFILKILIPDRLENLPLLFPLKRYRNRTGNSYSKSFET